MSSLNDIFKKLEVYSGNEEHEKVFEASLEYLKSASYDAKALKLVTVSLINMEHYLKAYKILKEYNDAPQDDLLLEKLYICYKLNLNKELGAEFEKLGDEIHGNRGLLHLKAQFLYRLGNYKEALEIYQSLVKDSIDANDVENVDISVNERAILADGYQAGIFNRLEPIDASTPAVSDSYDFVFNEALIQFGLKNFTKTLELLDVAEIKCKQLNTSHTDQLNELFPIKLQKAYVYETIGDLDKAREIYESIDPRQISDELNTLIYKNNLISLQNNTDFKPDYSRLVLKELGYPSSLNKFASRFSLLQKDQIFKNYYKLATQVGKRIKPKNKDITLHSYISLSKAGVDFDSDPKKQAKKAFKYAAKHKTIASALAAAQLNVQIGNFDAAVAVLESLEAKDRLIPTIASTLISLYDKLGGSAKKLEIFHLLHTKYTTGASIDSVEEYDFLKATALEFINADPEKSKELLTKLDESKPNALISLVLSGVQDSTLIDESNTRELTKGLEVEDIVKEGVERLSKQQNANQKSYRVHKKRVIKKKKPPKNYDENKQPDPERWLPLKDRTYYKPKKGKKKGNKDTQGGAADNSTEESFVTKKSTPVATHNKKNKKKGRK